MRFRPQGLATSIGSLPHLEAKEAIEIVMKNFPEIPAWPQLPQKSFYEDMKIQFSEGLPGLVFEPEVQRAYLDTRQSWDKKLEEFYQQYLSKNLEHFAISPPYALGFYAFLELLPRATSKEWIYLKGQVTGPISLGLSLTDENRRAVIYREEFLDVLTKQVVMKAKWQIIKLKKIFSKIIIFIDEPYLASFGSAYINLDREALIKSLQEVILAIQENEALAGIHCCGNTDWSLPLSTSLDILSFDAYEFIENLSLYSQALKAFFTRGGILGWGIVPSRRVEDEELRIERLWERLEQGFQRLRQKGIDLEVLLKSCLLTPSCGTGSLKMNISEKILESTRLLSESFREKYGEG